MLMSLLDYDLHPAYVFHKKRLEHRLMEDALHLALRVVVEFSIIWYSALVMHIAFI